MPLKCGIVGLPNVGKSSLFNAITSTSSAESANFPFCTIEPNIGKVTVPDKRLDQLAKMAETLNKVPTILEFVDIAGLVEGASKGEGLGNKFLANIRETDCIIHLVRCFIDDNITHVSGSIDSLRDIEIIETELLLADLENMEKRIANLEKKARSNDKNILKELELAKKIHQNLSNGTSVRFLEDFDEDESKLVKNMQLLTNKKVIYVCNVSEDEINSGNQQTKLVEEFAQKNNSETIIISAKIEEEIALLEDESDKKEFLATIGLKESGLDKIIKSSYVLLDLITFFTVGKKETRAWTIKKDYTAKQAAGVIHSDFERGFICADTIFFKDLLDIGSERDAKQAGKIRQEGREYKCLDGDVFQFKFNV